ncbi:MAG: hypothetical protein Ct9H300mP19_15640 [Dehalococcoidia bacterium]|nr:MAG: hypothetical protein Ct9H300mP19_15640 [Dehalococcoidia bacterium]
MDSNNWPECMACNVGGVLVPLSDFGAQGAPVHYKAWVCTNPECDFNLKIRKGNPFRRGHPKGARVR